MPSGMPMPRLTTLLGFSSNAARRAMILRSLIGIGGSEPARTLISPENAGIVLRAEGLPVIFGLGHHDAVDQNAGDLDLARIEAAALGDALDLRDDDAAGIVRGHGDGQRLQRQRLLLHGEIAVGIGGGGADDADVDRKRLVEQAFLAAERDQLDHVLSRAGVELAAAVARIDEGAQADAREMAGPVRRDVAKQMGDDALRQIIGLDLVGDRELLQFGREAPMAADDALDQSVMREMIEAAMLAVALPRGIDQRQVARLAVPV